MAKIGMQLREDAKYLKGLTESVQLVDEAVGATGKAAAMFLTSGGTTVVSAGSSFYSPEWWNTMRETFVWEVGSLHRP